MHMLLAGKIDLPCLLWGIFSSSLFFFFLAHWRYILPSPLPTPIRLNSCKTESISNHPPTTPQYLTTLSSQPAKNLPIPSNSITHPIPLLISPPPPPHHPLSSSLLPPPTPPPLSLLTPASTTLPNVHYPLVTSPFSQRKNVISLRGRERGVLCVRGRLVDFRKKTNQISINKYQLIGWGNDERIIHTQHDSVLSFEIVQESNFLFLHYYSSQFEFRIRCRLLR